MLEGEHRLAYQTGTVRVGSPYLGYHMAASYTWESVAATLDDLAESFEAFDVVAEAVAIFESIPAVVYLTIADLQPLLRLHRAIAGRIAMCAHAPDEYYAPERWVPHITITSGIDSREATRLAQSLRSQKIRWKIRIDNLALVTVDQGKCIASGRKQLL